MRAPVHASALLLVSAACATQSVQQDEHADHASPAPAQAGGVPTAGDAGDVQRQLPASAAEAAARLAASPRHAEWVTVAGESGDSTRTWVVYPERRDAAPVVVVVHEIFGLTPWIRAVADQLAAEGYIAVAPDLLTRYAIPGAPLDPSPDSARAAIRAVTPADMNRQVNAVARWAMGLPSAQRKYGVVGFCWGGTASFNHAVASPAGLAASVVYYGSSPATATLGTVNVPVLGLYGGNDQRVNATIPAADSALRSLGKTFEAQIFEGAGHGFLRQQDGMQGANMAATERAWPATIAWFRRHLGA
jgi:carboxymethylenebutenolidase